MATPAACRALAVALLTVSAASLVSGTPCPSEWLQSGAWCYLTNTSSSLSWAGAADLCQEHGGTLIMIKNRSKLLDIVDLLKGLESPPPPPPPTPDGSPTVGPPGRSEALARFGRSVGRFGRQSLRQRPARSPISYATASPTAMRETASLANAVGIDKRWWIGIQKTSGSTGIEARDDDVYDNFGEEKIIQNASSGESGAHLCVYITATDGLWYWSACDTAQRYICQKEADRVQVVVVTPEHSRPDPAWLRAHEAALEARLLRNDTTDDDKGEFSATKATMTPIPPTTTTTTPMPAMTTARANGTAGTTPSPCSGQNWWLLASRCHHLFLDAKSWSVAEQLCQAKGGHLTQFENEAAQATFRRQYSFNSGSIWIGLSRDSGSSTFRWTSGAQPDIFPWAPGHPVTADGTHNCVALDLSTIKWMTADCAVSKPFSCSRGVDATEQPPTVATTPSTVAAPCGGGGWWQFGSTCLLLASDTPASWHEADQACLHKSAMQVKIENYELNEHIRGKLNGVSAWIGLSKLNPAGTYQWTDGSPAGYNNWAGGRVTSADMASCVQLDGGHGYWRPVNCNAPQPFVCQKPADGSAPPQPPWPTPPPRSTCPPSWQPYFVDSCLQVFTQAITWENARQWCQNQAAGGDLLSVPDAVHQAYLTSAVRGSTDRLWISLTYGELDRQRFLTWTDERPVNYTNWAPGQPSAPCDSCPKTCGVVDGRETGTPAAWGDVVCLMSYGAVCQRPATPNNSISVAQTFCNNTDSQYIAAADACYKIVHDEMTWHDATDTCQNDGSALAYIGDIFDNADLVKLLYRAGRDMYWLGLSDTARHGIMEWTKPWPTTATFFNWDPDYTRQPTRESCAAFKAHTGRWQHRACSTERLPFVCQRAPDREAAAPPAGHCNADGGWVAGDSRCYRAFEPSGAGLNWTEAKADCEQQGYQLATVSSVADFRAIREAVQSLSSQFRAWIGLRSQESKEYAWTDGSPLAYRAWHRSEPVLAAACGQASRLTNGRWKTMRCSRKTAYICMTEMDSAGGTSAITREILPTGSGWNAFGVVILVLALTVALAGVGLWFARRQRVNWLPVWLLGPRGAHHSVENLAYSRHHNADSSDGTLENSSLNAIAANRWGSQEQLVIHEDL